MIFIFRKKIKK